MLDMSVTTDKGNRQMFSHILTLCHNNEHGIIAQLPTLSMDGMSICCNIEMQLYMCHLARAHSMWCT